MILRGISSCQLKFSRWWNMLSWICYKIFPNNNNNSHNSTNGRGRWNDTGRCSLLLLADVWCFTDLGWFRGRIKMLRKLSFVNMSMCVSSVKHSHWQTEITHTTSKSHLVQWRVVGERIQKWTQKTRISNKGLGRDYSLYKLLFYIWLYVFYSIYKILYINFI